ncbi:HEAT repeat domain-containing protein [Candidatus Binatia bacterium]|nr:HEAT repeat domain-containing protein [Candidatus Binatia bacterium]
MDKTLKAVAGLVGAPDVELRCAALLVLAQLGCGDDPVVAAVRGALRGPNVVVRDFALNFLARVRPKTALDDLLGLLDSDDDAVRRRATEILSAYGAATVSAARKLLKDAPRRRLNAIADLCGRVRSTAAFDLLFQLMAGGDYDLNRLVGELLEAAVRDLSEADRKGFYSRVERFAEDVHEDRVALVSALKLFGALGEPRCRKRLFPLLAKDHPHAVRTHALGALLQCLRGESLPAAEVEALLALLDEDDEAGILRPAVSLLEGQSFERKHLERLQRLAESPQPVVKRFAVHSLGTFDSGAVVKQLIGYLGDASYARRSEAASTLKRTPAARAAVMKELLACDDERRAWTLAEIALAHDRAWRKDVRDELWRRFAAAVDEREDRLYSAFLHVLRQLDGDGILERIRAAAEQRRKKKEYAVAARWLGLLRDTPAFGDEAKYALALCELKAHKRVAGGAVRRHDPALDRLRELAGGAMPVGERLRKERALAPEELFYVGFNLAEGTPAERAVAGEVLQYLAGKLGRTKVGKAARNKLRLLG